MTYKKNDEDREDQQGDESFEHIPLKEVLGFLRSLPATVFQVKRREDGRYFWMFYEGELAMEAGLGTDQLRGRKLTEVLPPNLPDDLVERIGSALAGDLQKEVYEADDRWLKLYLQRSQSTGGDSSVVDVDGAVTDVTQRVHAVNEQKKLYEDLKDRTQRLARAHDHTEQLNYMLSHDLRNPLTVILSLCEVMEREIRAGKGDLIKRVHRIRQAAKRMNEMLVAILKLSRSERAVPDRKEVDVSSMANDILKHLSGSEPHPQLKYRIEPGLRVSADPNLLRDLLENLLSNAWKYTNQSNRPRIWVEEKVMDDKGWICVRDNGIGFREEEGEELFIPFKRLESAQEFHGTGVGLATAKRIVERHGGVIEATGRPGEGAEFCFTLPDAESASSASEQDEELELSPVYG